jgi:hypothetical protein
MGHASTLLGSAALEEVAELGLGIETHRHAAFAVRDRNGKLIALAFAATALLDEGAWLAWILSVVPRENLHRSARWIEGRSMGEEKANKRRFRRFFRQTDVSHAPLRAFCDSYSRLTSRAGLSSRSAMNLVWRR